MQIDWYYIQHNWDWAGHVVEALVMAGVIAVLTLAVFKWRLAVAVGLAFAAGHFHGREKRDYELSVDMPPPHIRGYFMWDWSWDQATDFWPVAAVCIALMLAVSLRFRRQ